MHPRHTNWFAPCLGVGALLFSLGCTGSIDSGSPDGDEETENDPLNPTPNAEPPAEGTPVVHSILNGSFAPLPGYEVVPVDGRVQMTRYMDGTTQVDLVATGLGPNILHNTHLHALPCSYAGGGHYKMDPGVLEVVEANEIWPSFTTSEEGIGRASITAAHMTRGDAMSVVIHAADGAKMACADLYADDGGVVAAAGSIAPLVIDPLTDEPNITGSVSMSTTGISTKIDMSISGLVPDGEYASHVHALPCEVLAGGGHYKIDPVTEILDPLLIEQNELWPYIGIAPLGGVATVALTKDHNVRYDAQSIVIHRVLDDGLGNITKPKVACANLTRATYPAGATSGSAVLLEAGTERLANLTATAEMTRRLDGVTVVSMSAVGLEPDLGYAVHVHNLPCGVSNGGGHYLQDPLVTDVLETNELWLRLTAGSDTAAEATNFANHVARAEAASLVIHDPEDGSRLACVDLN